MASKKGIALPITIVVIIIIALIVLIAIAAFFSQSLRQGEGQMDNQQKWQRACSALKMRGCTEEVVCDEINPIKGGESTFLELCELISGTNTSVACCQMCCGDSSECDQGIGCTAS